MRQNSHSYSFAEVNLTGMLRQSDAGADQMKKMEDLNLQDETQWRGRLLASSYALRGLLTELGGWLAALVIAYQLDPKWPRYHLVLAIAAVMLVRMLSAHYDDWRKLKAIRKGTTAFVTQRRPDQTAP
jgi:hypothetical protein